ncbi:LysR substrate-binding domain-containing protein [Temperatibacter marinus]|uniref:LysR substrate-binding domain-containing protein n=1 Tax=Temperatibacter marinus TaxID=1456591 RepID=A0AA52ECL4_9PROT|nr:LysR substrate-binding domain-containing protein [Temperatibacter marinus]WND02942.1 LysR substrate-binding domain-containing protein [Temperatibacter marinus]
MQKLNITNLFGPLMQKIINHKKIPPLKALRGFEAATRHQSVKDAAEELCLTHPAISHQIKQIEEGLGLSLFAQEGRNIISTDEGRLFYPYVRAAFDSLIEGVHAVEQHSHARPLVLQSDVTASLRWLARRLPKFLREYPDIPINLSTSGHNNVFNELSADVGLIYLDKPLDHKKYEWVPLFDCTLFPVCSPIFRSQMGHGITPHTLQGFPLISLSTEDQSWNLWFESAGVEFQTQSMYLKVDTLAVALEMAIDGQGIALVNGPFVSEDMKKGALVQPVSHATLCQGGWGFICRKELAQSNRIRTFMNWFRGYE